MTRWRDVRCGLVMAAILVVGADCASATVPSLRYWKSLGASASSDDEIVTFRLDDEMYAHTRGGWPDLRIVDDADVETPYQVETAAEYREEKTRSTFVMEVVSLEEKGRDIEVVVRVPESIKDTKVNGLTIASRQKDFERKVAIAGSSDGTEWTPIVDALTIFDYSRYMNLRQLDLPLPSNSYRQFKLTIHDVINEKESMFTELQRTLQEGEETERSEKTVVAREPFHIDRIEAWHDVTKQKVRRVATERYTFDNFKVEPLPDTKQTAIAITTQRQPLSSFTIETSSRNFDRRIVVQAPAAEGADPRWVFVSEGRIFNFSLRNFLKYETKVGFPQRREGKYRLVIDNQDNPPLTITQVRGEGDVYRVAFLAEPEKRYRVYYGSDTAEPGRYETAAVLAALRREDFEPTEVPLGPQQDNTAFIVESNSQAGSLLNNWWFLGSVIALMVVILGWALFQAGVRLDALPEDDGSATPGT